MNGARFRILKTLRGAAAMVVCIVAALGCAPLTCAATFSFAGVALTPGSTARADVPLSEVEKAYVAEGGNAVPSHSVAVVALPRGFDPEKSWPVLVVFASSEHQHPNWYDLMVIYRSPARAEGWVLLAGDGPEQPSRIDSSGWRAGHTLAALDALNRSFPGATKWPIALAGQSGGAKRASYLAPLFAVAGYRIAGIFLEGMNEDRMTESYRHFRPGSGFLSIPIFFSSGRDDTISTLQQQTAVENAMRRTGFDNIRHETFPGGHTVLSSQLREALRWFRKAR